MCDNICSKMMHRIIDSQWNFGRNMSGFVVITVPEDGWVLAGAEEPWNTLMTNPGLYIQDWSLISLTPGAPFTNMV